MPESTELRTPDVNTASQRHWLYGFNATLLVVVGVAIVAFLMWATQVFTKDKAAWDLSSNGVNSLSASTKVLLKEIDATGKDYHLVTLFTDPTPNEKANGDLDKTAEKRRQVMDLLRLYARNSGHVMVEDQGDAASEEIERRIHDLYQGELKPYEEAVAKFDTLADKFKKFLNDQEAAIAAAASKDNVPAEERDAAGQLQTAFRQLPGDLDEMRRKIHKEQNQVLPPWSDLTDGIKATVDELGKKLDLLSDPAKLKQQDMPPVLLKYFTEKNADYKEIASAFKTYKTELDKLEPLKVQEVISNLHRNSVVVLGPTSAKIFSRYEIFEATPSRDNSDVVTTTFKGEELVSSALLAMAHPDKVKVVFVTPTAQQLTSDNGEYGDMAAVLKENNFDVLEWSPPGRPTPEGPPPGDLNPPASGKGVVWVVFPPGAPQMAFMAPPDATAAAAAVQKHIDQGGHVLFLAGPGGGGPLGGGDYPYAAALKSFGINVLSKYTVVHVIEGQNRSTGETEMQAAPYIDLDHFEKSQITEPLQSLPMALYPTNEVTAVDLMNPLPTGITAQILIKTPRSPDYFGTTSFSRTPKFNRDADLASPVPVAAMAVKNAGQKDAQGKSAEQRVIVVGCRGIAANVILEAAQPILVGNQIVRQQFFPGNDQFMRNVVLWLSGYENMIAVSAKANATTRIVIPQTSLVVIRYFVLPGIALLALVVGGLVWLARRR